MANVTLPTPVFVAGGALCLLAGYLVGAVAGPGTPDRTTATVASYDTATGRLCLSGDAAKEADGAAADGSLCGRWRRPSGARMPAAGDAFRFVTLQGRDADKRTTLVIYGNVVAR